MKTEWTPEEFYKSIVAQDDDEDWSEFGWVACVDGDQAGFAAYGHCSCYGTFDALFGHDRPSSMKTPWAWEGSVGELVDMARRRADPHLPSRVSGPDDCNYDHLMNVYDQALAWDRNGRK